MIGTFRIFLWHMGWNGFLERYVQRSKQPSVTSMPKYLMLPKTMQCVVLYCGVYLFYVDSLSTFLTDLNRCRPTLFMSVPRLWTKFQAGVLQKMSQRTLDILLWIPIVSWLIKWKILKNLGLDKCRLAGSGSSQMPEETMLWYRALGLDIIEGYGMTENFNYSHLGRPGQYKVGYIGFPHDDVEQRIAENGELQVKTPGKMMGYFKNPQAEKECLTEDGWVRTGDKGELDEQGRLKITGRTKEIFKTSKGKYVAPAPIENMFVANSLVDLACVSGNSQPQPHAIVQLSDSLKKAAAESLKERAKIEEELSMFVKNVVNPNVEAHERLAFVAIVKDSWLPENGFLTPTQKIKRSTIEDTYASLVNGWYSEKRSVVWVGDW